MASVKWLDAEGYAELSNLKPSAGSRFFDWIPDAEAIGPAEVGLGTGRISQFPFRDDYLVSFEIRGIPKTELDLMLRLQTHLLDGYIVALDDTVSHPMFETFALCSLAPDTEPTIDFTDSACEEYTFGVKLLAIAEADVPEDEPFYPPSEMVPGSEWPYAAIWWENTGEQEVSFYADYTGPNDTFPTSTPSSWTGTPVFYWDFGDGETAVTSVPYVTHQYSLVPLVNFWIAFNTLGDQGIEFYVDTFRQFTASVTLVDDIGVATAVTPPEDVTGFPGGSVPAVRDRMFQPPKTPQSDGVPQNHGGGMTVCHVSLHIEGLNFSYPHDDEYEIGELVGPGAWHGDATSLNGTVGITDFGNTHSVPIPLSTGPGSSFPLGAGLVAPPTFVPGTDDITGGPPANDSWANREVISRGAGSFGRSLRGATLDGPSFGGIERDIWFEWTAPFSGVASFTTAYTPNRAISETMLGVYTGSSLGSLVSVVDDVGSFAAVSFDCEEGTTYHIQVGCGNGEQGSVTLLWLIEVLWFIDVTPTGQSASASGGEIDFTATGRSQYFPVLGPPFPTGTITWSVPAAAGSIDSAGVFTAGPTPGTYEVTAIGDNGVSGVTEFTVAALSNDFFAGRSVITGTSGNLTVDTSTYTTEPDEPHIPPGAYPVSKTAWYEWTAPANGTATFDTLATADDSLDTIVGIYTGSALASLVQVALNDDDLPNPTLLSNVSFAATMGVSYKIQVAIYNGTPGGVLTVTWSLV